MSFDPNLPAPSSRILSAELRDQFNGLKALIDALVPIGSIMGWHKNFAGTPVLPGVWAECNGQTVNDVASPYHGMDLPDLNGVQSGVQRFLRGASASGGTGGSDSITIASEIPVDNNLDASTTTVVSGPQSDLPVLPSYFEVVWVLRIK